MNLNFYPKAKLTVAARRKCLVIFMISVLSLGYSFAQGPATALGFDGSSSIVSVPASSSVNLSDAITIEAWVYPTKSSTTVQDVICKSSSAVNNGYIFPRFTKRLESLQFFLNINGYGWQTLSVSYGEDKLNKWHHLAATYDGYYMTIYIDGVLAGTQAFAGTITVNNNPLTIGGQSGYTENFGGKIDEARIWSRALTPCEINNNLTCELNGPQTGLSAYYKFNQGILNGINLGISTVTDASGNGNDGTMSGFLLTGLLSNWAQGTVSGTCSVWTPVTAGASSASAVVPVGADINLIATGPAGASYSWTGPRGYTSNQQNPTISHVGTNASGVYTVTVSKSGCSASASTTVTVAPLAGALNFNTTDNVVSIPNAPSLNPTAAISIETWINPTSASPTTQNVISKSGKYINTGYIFPRTDDGWRSFSFWLDIGGNWKVLSAQFPSLNQWNHVAATYDGYFMKIYLNGVLKGTLAVSGPIVQNSNNLLIGQQADASENFVGSIDETRIWNRGLALCEIQNNMSCELNGANNGLSLQNGLVGYYRYNQGLASVDNTGGIVVADSSGHNNNGTMSSFVLNGANSNWVAGNVAATCTPFQAPVAIAGSNGPNVEVGNTVNLNASAGTAWAWTGPNNFTSNQQNPSIPNAGVNASGTYTVTITGGGCSSAASTNVTVAFKAGTLSFGGVNNLVTVQNSPSLNIAKEITLESWLYPTKGSGTQDVMCKSTLDENTGYIFPRTNDGWRTISFYLHLNGRYVALTAPYPGINQWHHAAATYDGYFMRIYIDGVMVASGEAAGNITVNTNNLVLGSQPGYGEFYSGQVDESRIWNRALNQCEIINNMNCELDPSQKTGLAAYYKYNQGFVGADNSTETTLLDASNNINNGTLGNFALTGSASNWSTFKITSTCALFTMPPVVAYASATVFGIGSTIQLFASGGNTYSWTGPNSFSSSNTNPIIPNAQIQESGTYTVTAPFVNCTVYASTRLDVSALGAISADGPTTFCPSTTVNLSISNSGSAYQWYRNAVLIPGAGATQSTYTASLSGDYTVSVTNGADLLLSAPLTLTVVDNLPPVVPTLPVLNLETPATVTAAPTATDNCRGTVTGTTTSATSFNIPGTYTITWKFDDQNGNVVTQDQQVVVVLGVDNIPPSLTVPSNKTANATVVDCGAIVNFAATATDNSGLPVTITYSQNPGTVFAAGTTTVTVTATDASDNTTIGTFTVTVIPVAGSVSGITTICTNATTALTTTLTGGTWSSNNLTVATVDATTGVVTGAAAGTAVITYANACGSAASATVTVNAIPVAPTVTVTNNCGSSILTASNTNGSLSWNTTPVSTTASINVAVAGTYSVTQTVNGCTSAPASGTSAPKSGPSVPVITVVNNCGSTTLSVAAGNCTFSWNTTPVSTGSSINVTTGGTYTVTATNAAGCSTASAPTAVTVNAVPSAPVITVTNNCGSTTLSVPAGSNTYSWNTIPAATTGTSINVTTPGTYTVTATNTANCSVSTSATVTINAVPSAPTVTVTNNCGSSTLTASNTTGNLSWNTTPVSTGSSITVTNAGTYSVTQTIGNCTSVPTSGIAAPKAVPSAPLITVANNCGSTTLSVAAGTNTYTWNTVPATTGTSINVTAPGTYTVTATNDVSCSASASATVTVNAIPATPVITVVNNCGSTTLSVAAGSNAYSWNTTPATTGTSINVTTPGTYTVTATTAANCSASASTTVTVNAVPSAPIITVVNNCGSTTLSVAAGSNTYAWNTVPATTGTLINVTAPGTYTVTATNAANCSTSASATVTVNAVPATPVITVVNNCGSTTLSVPAGSNTYSWNTTPATTGTSVNVTTPGTYTVTATTAANCSASASATVTVNAVPATPVITVVNNCGSTTLSVPAGSNTYSWNTTPATTGTSVSVTIPGTYTVTATNAANCSASASATVTVNANPTVAAIIGTTTVNIGATTQLSDATTGGVWSSNSANATVNAAGLVTGVTGGTAVISYTVTNNNGCSVTTTTTVTVNTCTTPAIAPVSNITANTGSACNAIVNYITNITGTPAPVVSYTFTGATTGTNAGNGSGSVFALGITTVTVKATNSCGTASTSFTVTVNDATAPTAVTKNITVSLDASGQANVTPSQVDNGSYDNCSGVTLAFKTAGTSSVTTGTINATADENGNLQLTAPAGGLITAINFASYGTPNGTAGSFTIGGCNAANSKSIVEGYALGKNSVTIPANNAVFSDPCYGTIKRLYVTATYQVSVAASATTVSSLTFNCSKIGANTVTLNVTDASGNTSLQTATVTVLSTATVVTGISNQTFCGNAGTYAIPAVSATNNCGITSLTYQVTGATSRSGSGVNATGSFNSGTSTITWTITDASGRTSSTSATVAISGTPVATIITGASSNDFCSEITLAGSSSVSNASYKWVLGSTTLGTSSQFSVGQASAEGIYQLYVTADGCTSSAATYNFQKQNLLSSYTILVYDDAYFGRYTKVATGSVGVMTAKGDTRFYSNSSVNGPNSFVKSPDIDLNGSNINITKQIIGLVAVTLPAIQYNTANPKIYSNYSTAQYATVTLSSNYNNLTIRKGTYATLSGTVFGTIELEQGASVRFTSTTLNIDKFRVDDGARDGYYSYVRFAPNTSVRISSEVNIGSQVLVNPDYNKVTFYMADNSNDEEKFTVKGADTKFVGNIYMPKGRLQVSTTDSDDDNHSSCNHAAHSSWNCPHKDHNHKDCDHKAHDASTCNDDVYMTGMFIVGDLDSKGNTVIWNSFDCSSGSLPVTMVNKATPAVATNSINQEKGIDTPVTTEEELKITVMPNPSTTVFTLKFESKYETPVSLRVMDASGRVVDAMTKIGSNSTIQIGSSYLSGTYFAEMTQGTTRKVIQLMKIK
jgi:hypothetical protein